MDAAGTKLRIYDSAVFHHLVSCVHKIVGNGHVDTGRLTKTGAQSRIRNNLITSKLKHQRWIFFVFYDVNTIVFPVSAAISRKPFKLFIKSEE